MSKVSLTLIFTFLMLFLAVFSQTPVAAAEPARFQKIAPGLFRSALANGDADYDFYHAQGIDTIVDLRGSLETESEREIAARLGFRYINIPLNLNSDAADYARAERAFFHAVDTARGGLVFHCKHGKDRTGLMAARYRVVRENWTPERAIAEWQSFGGYGEDWGAEIKSYFNSRTKRQHDLTCFELF